MTSKRFKFTREALELLEGDNHGFKVPWEVMLKWHDQLPEVEEQLSRLHRVRPLYSDSLSALEEFVTGDEKDQQRLRLTYSLHLAHKFLADAFGEGGES